MFDPAPFKVNNLFADALSCVATSYELYLWMCSTVIVAIFRASMNNYVVITILQQMGRQ